MASYPSYPPPPYSMGHHMESHNPYRRFLSPSPSRRTLAHQRSTSLPSAYFDGQLQYSMEPRRRRDPPSYYQQPSRRAPRHSRHQRASTSIDIIDRLDDAGVFQYHHEGPYDAACTDKNRHGRLSPVDALKESNAEALRATPHEKIRDCIDSHRPLDGVAFYPPGHTDDNGYSYDYEEGPNMVNDYGNFMRIPGAVSHSSPDYVKTVANCYGQKFTDEDFKNDPFYNTPLPKPFVSIRKAFQRRRNRRGTA